MPDVCLPIFSFHKADTDSVMLLEKKKKTIGMFYNKSDEERKIINSIISSPGVLSTEKPGNTTAITRYLV